MTALAQLAGWKLSPGRARLLNEGSWVALGQFGTALSALVGVRLLTEVVTPEVFGAVALLTGLATLGYNVFSSPFLLAAAQLHSEAVRRGELALLRHSVMRWVSRATAVLLALLLIGGAIYCHGVGLSGWPFVALAGVVMADAIRGLEQTWLVAERRQRASACWALGEGWGRPLLAVACVVTLGAKPEFVLLGYSLASLGVIALFFGHQRRHSTIEAPRDTTRVSHFEPQLWHFGLPLGALAVAHWIGASSDRYVIGSVMGLDEVGLYAAAVGLVSRPILMAGSIVGQTLRPLYIPAVSGAEIPQARRIFRYWLVATATAGVAGVLVLFSLGEVLVHWVLNERYHRVAPLLPWLAVGFALTALANALGERLLAHKRTRPYAVVHIVVAVLTVVVTWPLVRRFGLPGAAAGAACSAALLIALLTVAGRGLELNPTGST